jgi:CarD family transcriptional regulator
MWAKRSQEYLAKINTGEPAALAEVIRDLQSSGDGAGSSFSQRNLFELALERLAGEVAAVHRIGKPDAIELLNQALVQAKQNGTVEAQQPVLGA